MKRYCYFLILLFLIPLFSEAQIRLGDRIKRKVEQRVNKKVDKGTDDALDAMEGKNQDQPAEETRQQEGNSQVSADGGSDAGKPSLTTKGTVTANSRFDFVPGEKVIFYDDFSSSRIGEFPDFWLTNGMGQTVELNEYPGKWMQLSRSSRYAPDKVFSFPDDFTVEFDLIFLGPEKQNAGFIDFILFSDPENKPMAAYRNVSTRVRMDLNWNNSHFAFSDTETDISNRERNDILFNNNGKPLHISAAVNGQRFRFWVEEEKIADIPQLLPKGHQRNYIFLESRINGEAEDGYMILISNFRVAEGKPDLRKALEEDGKFTTRGITFDSGSDQLKAESHGVLKDIASVLQDDPSLKLKIVGHTDNEGADDFNMELSKKRAAAIKNALVNDYNIDDSRLQTDGKGESEPVADNTTAEGKANNRRAEFIKL